MYPKGYTAARRRCTQPRSVEIQITLQSSNNTNRRRQRRPIGRAGGLAQAVQALLRSANRRWQRSTRPLPPQGGGGDRRRRGGDDVTRDSRTRERGWPSVAILAQALCLNLSGVLTDRPCQAPWPAGHGIWLHDRPRSYACLRAGSEAHYSVHIRFTLNDVVDADGHERHHCRLFACCAFCTFSFPPTTTADPSGAGGPPRLHRNVSSDAGRLQWLGGG